MAGRGLEERSCGFKQSEETISRHFRILCAAREYKMERRPGLFSHAGSAGHEKRSCVQARSRGKAEMNKQTRSKTPTFLLELPLRVEQGQAKRLRAHLEAGRQFYNAMLC